MPNRIYTRTGDQGETGLFGGGRVAKDDVRVEAYGAVDELNALLGVALADLEDAAITERLLIVQSDLFTLGAHLATPRSDSAAASHLPPLPAERAPEMEKWIDEADEELPPLRVFILPGGNRTAAALHHARTVCRRAERRVVTLAGRQTVEPMVIVYLNRLSDLLFAFARLATHRAGETDRRWQSGRT
ncbi:MAG: cob(I)yrinic acid a,c-diamide adenosyltransferase [Longimicrobiales bacterium]